MVMISVLHVCARIVTVKKGDELITEHPHVASRPYRGICSQWCSPLRAGAVGEDREAIGSVAGREVV
jgi:hypothetical protein